MKIERIRLGKIEVPLIKPFKTALRTVDRIVSTVVRLETDTGEIGWGEAHPTGPITGESHESVRGAIANYILPGIQGKPIESLEEVFSALHGSCAGNTSAKAAVDMAVFDLFGKRYGLPLYRLFGGNSNETETNLTISVNPPDEMARDSVEAVSRGFRILKIKVGLDPGLDIERIKAVREAVGRDIVIRVDANQGWNAREAVRIMQELERADLRIELVEQPVKAKDFEGMRRVTRSICTPVLADESVFSPADALKLIGMGAADYINIKLMKTGGLNQGLLICSVAEATGTECFMGCMLETKLAVTAAAHLACGKKVITRCDLDSPFLCSEDPILGGARLEGACLRLTDAPGLGIEDLPTVAWD